MRRVARGETASFVGARAIRKDGKVIEVEGTFVPFALRGAQHVLGIYIDVSDRVRTETALRESEQRYRALFEASAHGISLRRRDSDTFLAVNPSLAKMFGYSREQLRSLTPRDLVHPERGDLYRRMMERVGRGETASFSGATGLCADGSQIQLEGSFIPVTVGEEEYVLGVFEDVTERIGAELALRESEEHYRSVFEATGDGLSILSLEGDTVSVNTALAGIIGLSRAEFMKLVPRDYLHPESLELLEDLLVAVRRGETFHGFGRGLHRDGSIVSFEVRAFPFSEHGEERALAVIRDITAQQQAEQQRQQAFREVQQLKDALEKERDYLREEVTVSLRFGEIVGDSRALRHVLSQIEAVAGTDAGVLILGESGVGKELVARAIRTQSGRASGPLVKVNCASVPRELFESEFFGHVKGAFTGAHRDRTGRFQLADGGTIFLDEIAEIPLELQGKLLRVLQEGEFERVGEGRTRRVDVRVVSATNRDLKREVESGSFREDLYYRLGVFPIEVPPLRRRRADILPLATHFLQQICAELDRDEMSLTRSQAERLESYSWPGNIRELRNVIEHAVILSRDRRLRLDLAMPLEPAEQTTDDRSPSRADRGGEILSVEEMRSFERPSSS